MYIIYPMKPINKKYLVPLQLMDSLYKFYTLLEKIWRGQSHWKILSFFSKSKLGQTRFHMSLVYYMLLLFVSVFAITMNPV